MCWTLKSCSRKTKLRGKIVASQLLLREEHEASRVEQRCGAFPPTLCRRRSYGAKRKTSRRVDPRSAASAASSCAGQELNEGRVVVYEPGNGAPTGQDRTEQPPGLGGRLACCFFLYLPCGSCCCGSPTIIVRWCFNGAPASHVSRSKPHVPARLRLRARKRRCCGPRAGPLLACEEHFPLRKLSWLMQHNCQVAVIFFLFSLTQGF